MSLISSFIHMMRDELLLVTLDFTTNLSSINSYMGFIVVRRKLREFPSFSIHRVLEKNNNIVFDTAIRMLIPFKLIQILVMFCARIYNNLFVDFYGSRRRCVFFFNLIGSTTDKDLPAFTSMLCQYFHIIKHIILLIQQDKQSAVREDPQSYFPPSTASNSYC